MGICVSAGADDVENTPGLCLVVHDWFAHPAVDAGMVRDGCKEATRAQNARVCGSDVCDYLLVVFNSDVEQGAARRWCLFRALVGSMAHSSDSNAVLCPQT
eukprot:CAMPEP_0170199366 /NCGR_PEP_ID=MMETSP0040_2-20121228/69298_1 /TAXON_ID=641309 /ORGANISM="Lotharella oceanica, Strain CCMP622" /LENGTH=100 /DNA_ID=CAMNT_0010449475 /DNA_START=456 /DNA_END=758 /DNA_ORIENTATION=+